MKLARTPLKTTAVISLSISLATAIVSISNAATLAVSDGKIYTNAKIKKVQKQDNIYFKITYTNGTRLIKPTDLEPVNLILKDGTFYGKAQITDITPNAVSIYSSGTLIIIRFDELSEDSLDIFDVPLKKEKIKKPADTQSEPDNATQNDISNEK